MGWLEDILKEVPLSAVLKERVALAEQKYEGAIKENEQLKQRVRDLEIENETLSKQLPNKQGSTLAEDTICVLREIFAADRNGAHVDDLAIALQMNRSLLQYHLDRLQGADFAFVADYHPINESEIWALTSEGRRYVVERKLNPK